MIDIELIYHSLPALLHGLWISTQITSISILLGFSLGTILGVGQSFGNTFVQSGIWAYVTLLKGTPLLVQILFMYYVLPQIGIVIPPFWAASLALGLNSSAYVSQIVLSGINGVSQGQIEAAQTLGLSQFDTIKHIVLPQAFRITMPALGNELVTLVKDSSLASLIGVMELSKEASIIRSRTYDAFSILLAVAFFYLCMTSLLTFCVQKFSQPVDEEVC